MKNVQTRGIILAEVLVAIGGLMTALFVLSSIMNSAWSTVAVSKNTLIAQYLETSAIEEVRALRDTNRLREPNDKSCWLGIEPAQDCDKAFNAKEGVSYIAKKDSSGYSVLAGDYVETLDINDNSGIDGSDKNYLLKIDDIGGLNGYSHDGILGDSIFYRGVKFIKVEEEFAKFEVLIQWMEGAKVREIKEVVTIVNS